MGLVAKEGVVGVFGVLFNTADSEDSALALLDEGSAEEIEASLSPVANAFDTASGGYGALAAFSFLLFNLLCAPCFAAMGAIKREMNSARWTWFALGYQTAYAFAVSLIVFRIGVLLSGGGFTVWTVLALLLLGGMIFQLTRKNKHIIA